MVRVLTVQLLIFFANCTPPKVLIFSAALVATCQRLICRDCVVVDRTHENHDYDLVEKVAPGYKKALLESLDPVQQTQGKVAEAISQVEKARERNYKPWECSRTSDHLSFDSQGNIYITDTKNYRVQVLTQEGEFIHMFGAKGDKPGEFLHPSWIHADGEYVYVTDYRSRYVSVFNVSGEFIHRFGADVFGHPEGIVVDEDGFVYVADSDKRMVFVF